MKQKLFNKNFTLVVIGQIISLFGNVILRFALPLHLLHVTGSPSVYGIVTALSFLPMIVLSLIGGVLADRLNKRNIMVILDFITAFVIIVLYSLLDIIPTIPLFAITLMILFGIAGTYQPVVQASIPVLVPTDKIFPGNAIINQVTTLSNLIGPLFAGVLYASLGIESILFVSVICFIFSAVMEIFIKIPHTKLKRDKGVVAIVRDDLSESYLFIKHEKPIYIPMGIIVALFNLVLTSALIIGIPVVITTTLNFDSSMLGISQGIMAAGGLLGGVMAMILSAKLSIKKAHHLLIICSISVFIMGLSLLSDSPLFSYVVITAMSAAMMATSTLFSIQLFTVFQTQTPPHLIGKVMAVVIAIAMCAQPIGQALYGVLFDVFATNNWCILVGASLAGLLISIYSKRVFINID